MAGSRRSPAEDPERQRTSTGNSVYIGPLTVVTQGGAVGHHTVVGAHSMVSHDLALNEVVLTGQTEEERIFLMRPSVGEEELEFVRQVFESKWLSEGWAVKDFEQAMAERVGAKHAISTTSATTALELTMRALGVGPGDEVIVSDFTHPATALCVLAVGAEPVLVDVDLATYNTTADHIEAAITTRTKAAIPVSIFGNPLEMGPINEMARRRGLTIIDDAACTLGAKLDGRPVGSLADMTVFSFHPRKVFTMGEGGVVTTDNDDWAKMMNSIKRFGTEGGRFVRYGTNWRLSAVLAAVGLGQVRKVDEILTGRRAQAARYDKLLAGLDGVVTPVVTPGGDHNYQTYAAYLSKPGARDRVLGELRGKQIEVQIGTNALHAEPFFADTKRSGDLANSRSLFENLLSLPMHHELTETAQERVVAELKASLGA